MEPQRNRRIEEQSPRERMWGSGGFGLLDTFVVLGLGLGLLAVVIGNLSNNRSQLAEVKSKLKLSDVEAQVWTVFAGSNVGDQVLRRFVSGSATPRPHRWEDPFPAEEPIRLTPNRSCPSEDSNWTSVVSHRSPVDVLYLRGPVAVTGLPLKSEPRLRLDELYLVQFGNQGQCPNRSDCYQKPCRFRLNLRLSALSASGGNLGSKEISVPLNCSTRQVPGTADEGGDFDVLENCLLREVPFPTPTPTVTQCLGDLNQDGRTDYFDLKLLERVWGGVPAQVGTGPDLIAQFEAPEGTMEWVAHRLAGGPWPSPAPSPVYGASFFNAMRELHKKADISPVASASSVPGDGRVDGDDLGLLLGDFGCRIAATAQNTCFKDTPLFHLYSRAASVAQPVNILDSADRVQFEYCATATAADMTGARLKKCAGMNLDFKCQKVSGATQIQGNYCRLSGQTVAAPGYRVVARGDLEMLDFLLLMQATLPRFKQTGCSSSATAPKYPPNWSNAKAPGPSFNLAAPLDTGLDQINSGNVGNTLNQ